MCSSLRIHGLWRRLDWDCCCNAKNRDCPAGGSLSLQIATWNVTIQRLVYSLSDCIGRKDRRQWSPHSAMTVDVFSMRMRMMGWWWWLWRRRNLIDSRCYCIDYGPTLKCCCCRFRKRKNRWPNHDCRFDTQSRSNGGVPNRLAV